MIEPSSDSPDADERMICPSCHASNDPLARYCVQCNVPLDSGVMLDPIGQIQAQGFALRQATTGQPNLYVVIGIWLIFLPLLIASGCTVVAGIYSGYFRMDGESLLGLAIQLAGTLFSVAMLYLTTSNYLKIRRGAAKPTNQPD